MIKLFPEKTSTVFRAENISTLEARPPQNEAFASFALTDALLLEAGENGSPAIHIWQTEKPTVILGMMDTKLTHFDAALQFLKEQQHDFFVRNAGGLGIVSDKGILNFSLSMKNPSSKRLSIEEGYQLAFSFLASALKEVPLHLEVREVPDSYCPGDFDILADGKKIAGLAQRRAQNGLGIMGYLSVNGDQEKRTQLMKTFYEIGKSDASNQQRFPDITLASMGTLSAALNRPITLEEVKEKMFRVLDLDTNGKVSIPSDSLKVRYQESVDSLLTRNRRMLHSSFQEEVFV